MAKNKKEEKSPLLIKKDEIIKKPKYTEDEEFYLSSLKERMENARDNRDQSHDEFDGMDYVTYYDTNERLANTFIKPKINKEDSNFQSGTIRQKLFSLLSAIVNLNLTGDISAFDQDGFEIQQLGDGMEDIILKTNELDGDDEKKLMRQYELLKHGSVFVEEIWSEKQKVIKKPNKKFDGSLKDFDFTQATKKAFARPTRNLIPGVNVYLGDITVYGNTQEQPFIFTVDVMPYSKAKEIFGKWERWEFVPKKIERIAPEGESTINKDWTLLEDVKQGNVEIVRYMDKPNNEFAIILNGVLMTPVGMPFPWGYEDYNIEQQNLEPIHSKFAYGKSLVARTKQKVELLDEMMKLAVLKTQKSFMPPYLNISGRVLSSRIFMPGKISHGIPPNSLVPISDKEGQGVTQSEFNMISEIQRSIDAETVSPVFSGQSPGGDPTATEIIEVQRQARMMLGLSIFAMAMLEWKLEWLRLKNVLANWFDEEDQIVDKARDVMRSKFRKVSTPQMVEGEGMGRRIVIPTKEIPSGQAIMETEDRLSKEQGMPIRIIFLNPEEVTNSKLIWQIVVIPKERKTSEVEKLLFRAFMQDILPLQPNMEYLKERAASVWGENPAKLFGKGPEQLKQEAAMMEQEGQGTVSPRVKLPTAEKAAGQAMDNQLKMGA